MKKYSSFVMNKKHNKCLIIAPHQDDEILGCSALLEINSHQFHDVWFIVKGGGLSPNHPDLIGNELHKVRSEESKKALSCFKNVDEIKFLDVERINNEYVEKNKVEGIIAYHMASNGEKYSQILTTSRFDKHDEHKIIGQIVMELSNAMDFEHKVLYFYICKELELEHNTLEEHIAIINFKLTDKQLQIKKTLIKIFETQKHFLPNIVERPSYKYERFFNE